jgi:hypothetical protein
MPHLSACHKHLYKQRTVLLSINYTKQNYVLYIVVENAVLRTNDEKVFGTLDVSRCFRTPTLKISEKDKTFKARGCFDFI